MHPARLAILDVLRDGEQCVCHMEAFLGYRQAYISQQLSVLRDAGLIQDRRDGWNIFYRVVKPEIYLLMDAAQNVMGEAAVTQKAKHKGPTCPCPKCNSASQPARC